MACTINVTGGILEQPEIDAYITRATEKYGREPLHIDIRVDGDFVELDYEFEPKPFHRIRRITGYLVGSLERFNDGKRAEEADRVKHSFRKNAILNGWTSPPQKRFIRHLSCNKEEFTVVASRACGYP